MIVWKFGGGGGGAAAPSAPPPPSRHLYAYGHYDFNKESV